MQFTGITITGGMNALPSTNVPDAPTVGTATSTSSNTATVAFTAPASNGNSTIISYTAISTPGNVTGTLIQSGSGTITVTGLAPSTSYTFKVFATNSIGSSALSSASNSITTSAPAIGVYSWGINNYYQLALIDTVDRSSPTQIGTDTNWNRVNPGFNYTLSTKNDGTLWALGGRATWGGFGIPDFYVSSPTQIGTLTNWGVLGIGGETSMAVKTDGTLWGWGYVGGAPFSNPPNLGQSSPVIIGSDTDWTDVFQTSTFGLALKTDNTLWSWGDNGSGALGTNSNLSTNSPVQVGYDTNWCSIGGILYSALATRTDGTLWAWGNNDNGQLGLNDLISRSSPVQIGSLTTWSKILRSSYGNATGMFAIKNNGTLWAWGSNGNGALGFNNTTASSSPVQVGSDNTWNTITTAGQTSSFSMANKIDGTLWSWGINDNGQLGQNDTVSRSSPTQVGSGTTWVNSITAGNQFTIALNGSETVPGTPTILSAEAVTSTSVRVGVAAPIVFGTDGYVTYTATSSPGQFTGTLSNKYGGGGIIVSNLVPGISYTFTVTATNSVGTSAASSPSNSVTPVDVPNPTLNLLVAGLNSNGQLGLNDLISRSSPTQVGSINWNTISSASLNNASIKTDGTLWMWGLNSNGELGLNDNVDRSAPIQIGNSYWSVISTNSTSVGAISLDGTLWMWGNNQYGQLGLNDLVHRSSPVQVGSGADWRNVSVRGGATIAIKTNGTLWAWGYNAQGSLGDNNRVSKSSPVQIGSDTNWDYVVGLGGVSVNTTSFIARKTNGTLWSWGYGSEGNLGDNTTLHRSSPTQIGTGIDWSKIAGSTSSGVAVKTNGTIWSWGGNSTGQLGLNDLVHRSSPTQIGSGTDWLLPGGNSGFVVIKTNGTLWAWGSNANGQLGTNNTLSRSSPVQIGSSTNWLRLPSYGNGQQMIVLQGTSAKPDAPTNVVATSTSTTSVSVSFTRPLSDNGSDIFQYTVTSNPSNIKAYSSTYGTITVSGLNPQSSYTFTVTATNSVGESLPSTASNSVTTDIPTTTELYTWGVNTFGQTGLNNILPSSSPAQVGADSTWNTITAGYDHTLATKKDGTLWAWGANDVGQLGQNNVIDRSSPVQIGSLTNWRGAVAVDSNTTGMSIAIKTDGTLWVWGDIGSNYKSGLTNRAVGYYSSPVQVGFDNNWANVYSGTYITVALKTNGTLWTWGYNHYGQLGQNNVTIQYSPVQVGSDYNWNIFGGLLETVLAIKTNGTLWAWGNNTFGQLGLNDLISRSSPVQVGSLTNWNTLAITSGVNADSSIAIKTDGTLWSWGDGANGQTGQGNTLDKSSPVQVGSDTNWLTVNNGGVIGAAIAVKTDGTLWGWGYNANGQLGLNDDVGRNAPTQIGSNTNWLTPLAPSRSGDVAGGIAGEATVPAAPTLLRASLINTVTANVEVLSPVSNGGSPITLYTVTCLPGNVQYPLGFTNTANFGSGGGTIQITGLSPNVTYTFTVTATNSIGTSIPSNSSSVTTSTTATTTIDYIVVAGGGGGGRDAAGGGGAGGFLTDTGYGVTPGIPITITIGAGGAGTLVDTQPGDNGSNSVFGSVTAIGGGGGGCGATGTNSQNGSTGGSGGGGGSYSRTGGSGTVGQGYGGGTGNGTNDNGGGGGGAGGAGSSAAIGSQGGPGLQGFDGKYYAGGGGGGRRSISSASGNGLGGIGGGGQGQGASSSTIYIISNGSINSGGGGGGGSPLAGDGAGGGSGVVILRYPDSYALASSTTGTISTVQSGGYRYYTFTSSGSITF